MSKYFGSLLSKMENNNNELKLSVEPLDVLLILFHKLKLFNIEVQSTSPSV